MGRRVYLQYHLIAKPTEIFCPPIAHKLNAYRRNTAKIIRYTRIVLYTVAALLVSGHTLCAEKPVTVRQPEFIPADRVLTLEDCINLALQNQSTIRLAQAQILTQTGAVHVARSALLPTASVSSSTAVEGGVGGFNMPITFTANQLIYDFGHTPALSNEAKQTLAADVQGLYVAGSDTVLNVKTAYYTLLQDTHLVDVFAQTLEMQNAHVAQAVAQEEAGVAPHANVLTAQAAAASAQFDLVTAQNTANQARINLNSAMGIDVRSPIHITEAAEPNAPTPTADEAMATAMAHRPEICRDIHLILAQRAAVRAAAALNLPAFTASANFTPNPGATGGFVQEQPLIVQLNIQWAFLDFGATAGAIQEAHGQVATAQENLYNDRQTISTQVMQALLNITAAEAQEASAVAEVASAEENLASAVGSFTAGIGIFLNVIDAQAALLKAQVDRYTALYGLSIARANLQHATGGTVPALTTEPPHPGMPPIAPTTIRAVPVTAPITPAIPPTPVPTVMPATPASPVTPTSPGAPPTMPTSTSTVQPISSGKDITANGIASK